MSSPTAYQSTAPRPPASQATSIEQQRAIAQVQSQVIVAQNCPRDMNRAWAEMRDACSRTALAERAFYRVTNRGKGPSVHLLRELARIFGNIEHGMHELARDDHRGAEGESEVQAYAWDIQKNTRSTRTFIVPHAQMVTVNDKLIRRAITNLNDVNLNNQNQASRAVRECITTILPRDFMEEAQTLCSNTLHKGDGTPLQERIQNMIAKFVELNVTLRQLESTTGKKRGQWDAADVAELGISYISITRDGFDKAELFPPLADVSASEILSAPKAAAKSKVQKVEDVAPPTETAADTPAEPPADADSETSAESNPEPEHTAAQQDTAEPTAIADVQMADRDQMNTIAALRKRQKYNINDWLEHIHNTIGVKVERISQLTADQAAQLIAVYDEDDAT